MEWNSNMWDTAYPYKHRRDLNQRVGTLGLTPMLWDLPTTGSARVTFSRTNGGGMQNWDMSVILRTFHPDQMRSVIRCNFA